MIVQIKKSGADTVALLGGNDPVAWTVNLVLLGWIAYESYPLPVGIVRWVWRVIRWQLWGLA